MRKIDDYSDIQQWGYLDARLGKGFSGTKAQVTIQVQNAYVAAGIPFHEKEIPALIEDFMCAQGLAKHCSERIEGLGDLVHIAAVPVARMLDAVLGTSLVPCAEAMDSPCSKRRRALNKAVPL